MFDLEQAIVNWKAALQQTDSIFAEDSDELESHLRETIATLVAKDLSEEESFWIARRRLGTVSSLCDEFNKVNVNRVWRRRLTWMLYGYLLVRAFGAVVSPVVWASGMVSLRSGLGATPSAMVTWLLDISCWLAFLGLSYWYSRRSSSSTSPDSHSIIALLGIALIPMLSQGLAVCARYLYADYLDGIIEPAGTIAYVRLYIVGQYGASLCIALAIVGMIILTSEKPSQHAVD